MADGWARLVSDGQQTASLVLVQQAQRVWLVVVCTVEVQCANDVSGTTGTSVTPSEWC
jgi:hypothetical protein